MYCLSSGTTFSDKGTILSLLWKSAYACVKFSKFIGTGLRCKGSYDPNILEWISYQIRKKIADLVRDADEWIYALRQCCTEQVQAGWGRILGESMEKAGMDDAKGILECDVFL